MRISKESTIEEIAAIVSDKLSQAGFAAVLSGGAVVSIYTENEYESKDLDFVTSESLEEIADTLKEIGFTKSKSRYFASSDTDYYIEFPPSPLAIGDQPVKKWAKRKTKFGTIQMLSPTQCVMDRLAGFYFWNDRQNLDQAVMVVLKQPVNLKEIKAWSIKEGKEESLQEFLEAVKTKRN